MTKRAGELIPGGRASFNNIVLLSRGSNFVFLSVLAEKLVMSKGEEKDGDEERSLLL